MRRNPVFASFVCFSRQAVAEKGVRILGTGFAELSEKKHSISREPRSKRNYLFMTVRN
ncbi:hypothetical protein BC830DRAFT_1152652 [Chytriomyces sp. MP71]|nr:hypothetical protein BC830DRAFT_1152652 [Chytriomyces sp. MP71]